MSLNGKVVYYAIIITMESFDKEAVYRQFERTAHVLNKTKLVCRYDIQLQTYLAIADWLPVKLIARVIFVTEKPKKEEIKNWLPCTDTPLLLR